MFFKMRVFVILVSLLVTQIYSASLPENLSKKHEELLSKLSDYRLVRPYRSTSEGEFMTYDLSTQSEEDHLEFRRTTRDHNERRRKRSIQNGGTGEEFIDDHEDLSGEDARFHFIVDGFGSRLRLNVTRNLELFSPGFKVNWYSENGDITEEVPDVRCFYQGAVNHDPLSSAAVSNCQGLSGWLQYGNEEYIIEPLLPSQLGVPDIEEDHGLHIMYRPADHGGILIDGSSLIPQSDTEKQEHSNEHSRSDRERRSLLDDEMHWVELMVAADHTMVDFHGDDLPTYIGTMLNIVNMAYAHPSLGLNIKIVLTKLNVLSKTLSREIYDEEGSLNSLTRFCEWASARSSYDEDSPDHHDAAAFIHRLTVGTAGFAWTGKMCTFTQSGTLNRDEGLLSSFVIAHEIGHLFGLEHDEGTRCGRDAFNRSLMAPFVAATHDHYHWSECSKRKMFEMLDKYTCILDDPFNTTTDLVYSGMLYSLDEQCEFDYGHGSSACNGEYRVSLCGKLWCTDPSNNQSQCLNRRGSVPLDGTYCGEEKWCVSGECQYMDERIDGGWSPWSVWGQCTFPCGVGGERRSRTCENPKPQGGGSCDGNDAEYYICNLEPCDTSPDRRAEQCMNIAGKWLYKEENDIWTPSQIRTESQRCKLTCQSQQTKVIVTSEENVIDGTSCSYEDHESVCIQGQCVFVGCDLQYGSTLRRDNCGICGGDNTRCRLVSASVDYMPKLVKNYMRFGFIPENMRKYRLVTTIPFGAMNVHIEEIKEGPYFIALQIDNDGQFILNGGALQQESHEFIINVTRFVYSSSSLEKLYVKGPLPWDITLRVYIGEEISDVSVKWMYYTQTDSFIQGALPAHTEESLSTIPLPEIPELPLAPGVPDGLKWEAMGWTPCTRLCDTGESFYQYRCVNISTSIGIPERLCNLENYQADDISKVCNQQECELMETHPSAHTFVWQTSRWSFCSKTCGSGGLRARDTFCVNVTLERGVVLQQDEVDNGYCDPHDKPQKVALCILRKCPADWVMSQWSECSVTCGTGFKSRAAICNKPLGLEMDYNCYRRKPDTQKTCTVDEPCPEVPCVTSGGKFCKPKYWSSHCHFTGYDLICCATCEEARMRFEAERNMAPQPLGLLLALPPRGQTLGGSNAPKKKTKYVANNNRNRNQQRGKNRNKKRKKNKKGRS